MKIAIIGGGIIGYCSAWYLNQSGHDVTVIEKVSDQSSPSYGNAGMVVPSHFIPLASPGIISKGLKWMLRQDSPFYIKPRLNLELFHWIWQFYKHANSQHVERSMVLLKSLNVTSGKLYRELISQLNTDVAYNSKGLLMVYNTQEGEKEESATAKMAEKIGIEAQVLNQNDLQQLEKGINYEVRGAVYYPGDACMNPSMFMNALEQKLQMGGVKILKDTEIFDVFEENGAIKWIKTQNNEITSDYFVLAAGIFSSYLAHKIGLRLPLQGGKGYSVDAKPGPIPEVCSILTEAKVAITPMGSNVRLAGTMEISGRDMHINRKRVEGYLKAVSSYIPQYNLEELNQLDVWAGLRPCSPDGLPYLGKSDKIKNLVVATGHAMMGFSLGPVTGMLVSDIINGKETPIDITALNPERYFSK